MKFNIITILLISFMSLMYSCRSQSIDEMPGIYVNTNFEYDPFIADIPYSIDTLVLNNDYSFHSNFFGNGVFFLNSNKIKLLYKYELGTASFEAIVKSDSKGNPKIILFEGMDHHYRKIK